MDDGEKIDCLETLIHDTVYGRASQKEGRIPSRSEAILPSDDELETILRQAASDSFFSSDYLIEYEFDTIQLIGKEPITYREFAEDLKHRPSLVNLLQLPANSQETSHRDFIE